MPKNSLVNFINEKMSMSAVYQPLILRELLINDGKCDKEELAATLSNYDEAVHDYYKKVLMRWPYDTLVKKHKLLNYNKQEKTFSLCVNPSKHEAKQAIKLCNEKIQDWLINERKNKPAAFKSNLRYEIIKEAKGKCSACGISIKIKPIDVDHIIPKKYADRKSKVILEDGRKVDMNSKENLQALCFSCNRGKKANDSTDFRQKNKLVRDKIPEMMISEGKNLNFESLKGKKLQKLLDEKLIEEIEEYFYESGTENKVLELVDVIEVCFAIAEEKGYSKRSFQRFLEEKKNKKGTFKKGFVLHLDYK